MKSYSTNSAKVPITPTTAATSAPTNMVYIPANSSWLFEVHGVEVNRPGVICVSNFHLRSRDVLLTPRTTLVLTFNIPSWMKLSLNGNIIFYCFWTYAYSSHSGRIDMSAFYIDKYPVTNSQFEQFLSASNYVPMDAHNFLLVWSGFTAFANYCRIGRMAHSPQDGKTSQ